MKTLTRLAAGAALTVALIAGTVVPASAAGGVAPAALAAGCSALPTTTTESDGVTGTIFWKRMQCLASMDSTQPYTGPIDGVMGPNSWIGVSARMKVGNYYAPAYPSSNYQSPLNILALQKWAVANGRLSQSEVDGIPDVRTWQAIAWCLNRAF